MAKKYNSRTDFNIPKQKSFSGNSPTEKAMRFAWEYLAPHNPADVVTSFGTAKVLKYAGKGIAKGTKKVIKAANKPKKVTKTTKKK